MMIQPSNRLNGIGEYYFSQKLREIEELNKAGKNIINLGIGSPDLPPHTDVIKTLHAESLKQNTHSYQSYKGSALLRNALADWYQLWYKVSLNADTEILPLMGSKEGIMHICMAFLNSGDIALVPNPGYPTYASAVTLAGGRIQEYSVRDDSFLDIKNDGSIKLAFFNYPHMPTGKLPAEGMFEKIVAWAKKEKILVVHDNPYSFILNENPESMLAADGAKECVIELNSLSKSHNMAGWRVGAAFGAKELLNEILRFKSNMDSGMFLPVQLAAAKALSLDKTWYSSLNNIYKTRRQKVYAILDLLQCRYTKEQAGLFIWAKVPDNYKDGFAMSDELLYNAAVFITPGGIFGSEGNGFVRISLCSSEEKLEEVLTRLRNLLNM